jgi:competence protein ComEC
MLRDKAGDYARDTMAENAGVDGEALLLSEQSFASCSRDACLATIASGGRTFRILATRSLYQLPIDQLTAACSSADIVVSDRRLPRTCTPKWLKLDALTLRKTGGVAIALSSGRIVTVRSPDDHHPWMTVASGQPRQPGGGDDSRRRRGGRDDASAFVP